MCFTELEILYCNHITGYRAVNPAKCDIKSPDGPVCDKPHGYYARYITGQCQECFDSKPRESFATGVYGEYVKMTCASCKGGNRSEKCSHIEKRVLLRVRRTGRGRTNFDRSSNADVSWSQTNHLPFIQPKNPCPDTHSPNDPLKDRTSQLHSLTDGSSSVSHDHSEIQSYENTNAAGFIAGSNMPLLNRWAYQNLPTAPKARLEELVKSQDKYHEELGYIKNGWSQRKPRQTLCQRSTLTQNRVAKSCGRLMSGLHRAISNHNDSDTAEPYAKENKITGYQLPSNGSKTHELASNCSFNPAADRSAQDPVQAHLAPDYANQASIPAREDNDLNWLLEDFQMPYEQPDPQQTYPAPSSSDFNTDFNIFGVKVPDWSDYQVLGLQVPEDDLLATPVKLS